MNDNLRGNSVRLGGSNNNYAFVNFQLAGQDIAGNYSLINYQFYAHFERADAELRAGVVNTNAGQVYNNGGRIKGFQGLATRDVPIASGTVRIDHRPDGTAEFQIGVSLFFYNTGTSAGTSRVYNLPTIPRQSQPTFSKNLYTVGEQIWLNMNRKANFTHIGSLQIPDQNEIVRFEHAQGEFVWTPNEREIDEIYKRMANTTRTSLGADITTWNGGTQIGGLTYTNVEIQINPETVKPTFNDFVYKDVNPKTVAITGNNQILIKGYSQFKATVLAKDKMTTKKYATPVKYRLELDGQASELNYSDTQNLEFPSQTVNSDGTKTATVTAIDSRGITTSVNKNITVLSHLQPSINIEAKRRNNFDNITSLKISGSFSPLRVNDQDKNRIETVKYRYKNSNGSFGAWKSLELTQSNGSFTAKEDFLDLNSADYYDIEIQVDDRLSSKNEIVRVEAGKPLVFFSNNKEKVGINKVPEFGDLDVLGDIYSRGRKVLTDSQEDTDHWEMIDMGWGARGLFYKKNGFCGFRLSFTGNYGNGRMLEKIKEKYWPKHETAFAGICINNNRHSGGFIIKLGLNGEIEKRGTDSYEEYHVSGVYLAKNNL